MPSVPRGDHNIPTLIHDHDRILEAIERRYGKKTTIGVFHSVSTLIVLLSFSDRYSGLVLFDPPICKPGGGQAEFDAAAERTAAGTRRRGHRFRTEEEFADFLAYMPGFLRVVPGVRQLMASTTLRRSADGQGYELRCPREYEAQVTDYVRSFSPLLDLAILPCPAKVIGADPTLPYAYLPTFDLAHVQTVDYDFLPEATHLLQLEKPAECVRDAPGVLASSTGLRRIGALLPSTNSQSLSSERRESVNSPGYPFGPRNQWRRRSNG